MEKEVRNEKRKALNDSEVLDIVDGKANIVMYSDLWRYNSIDELVKPHGAAFILYQQRPTYGHWCAVTKNKNLISFFDPYGVYPDAQLEWTKPAMREKLNMDYPYLSDLLAHSPSHYKLEWNKHQYQKYSKDVASCGRWCALFIAFKDLGLTEFAKLFDLNVKDNDDIVTLLTMLELGD